MTGGLARLALEAANRVDPERVIGLTRDLVRVRSVVDREAGTTEAEAAALVAAILTDSGFQPLIEEVAPDRPNIICDWSGTDFDPLRDRTLMFEGHTDVVTEGDSALWTRPPFAADLVEGCVYGRGSADMKGGVAAAITALEAIRAVAPDLRGRIRLGFVVDEEGMMLGIKHFIARGWADEVDGAIVCEPEENEICLFQKGAMRVGVRFAGVMSHGAMPYAGVNPITALADFVGRTESFQRQEQERLGPHAQLGLPWFTPTVVRAPPGGEAQLNVMPALADLSLDIRTIPGQVHADILEALQGIAGEVERRSLGLSVSLDCFESRPWTETFADNPLVRAIERAYPAILGTAPRYGGVPGATDGTFLSATAGVPVVIIGPGDRTIPHRCDEFVRTGELVEAARLYAAIAILYLGCGSAGCGPEDLDEST